MFFRAFTPKLSQPLFYFVPQETSQPNWFGDPQIGAQYLVIGFKMSDLDFWWQTAGGGGIAWSWNLMTILLIWAGFRWHARYTRLEPTDHRPICWEEEVSYCFEAKKSLSPFPPVKRIFQFDLYSHLKSVDISKLENVDPSPGLVSKNGEGVKLWDAFPKCAQQRNCTVEVYYLGFRGANFGLDEFLLQSTDFFAAHKFS